MNKITLVGRLGQDPELKTSKGGKSFAKFSIATNDGYGDNKKTNWHSCTAFGKAAELIEKYVKKGSEIAVSGSIDYNKHEEKIYTNILVNDFTFIGAKGETTVEVPTIPSFETTDNITDEDPDDLPW